MIRLTVLYNLPENTDESEFLKWRMTEHQENNAAMPGVTNTDFARIIDSWPEGAIGDYRFQTIVEWPDKATFEKSFYDETVQADLKENLERLGDYSFLVSEVLN